VRQEQPLTFADSEPEPDVAVETGASADYRSSHTSTAILIIEVAVSSADVDRAKASLYAAAGVLEYLIVLPDERRVEAYTGPQVSAYLHQQSFGAGEALRLSSWPQRALDVSSLFPD